MQSSELMRASVKRLPVYQPGKPIELVARECGLDPREVVKLASNENPLGSSPRALEAARHALADTWLYPDNAGYFLTRALAARLGVADRQIVLAAGSNEIFYRLCDLFVEPGVEVVMGAHAFISYKIATLLHDGRPVETAMPDLVHDPAAMLAAVTDRTRLVFLPNPNNPTGTALGAGEVLEFARSLPDHVVFCYDEAYAEYQSRPADLRPLIAEGRKVVCTRTFSKIYGLAGLRIGYAYTTPDLADALNAVRPPFNTGSVAQAAALAALDDTAFVDQSRHCNMAGQLQIEKGLAALGVESVRSEANFTLVRLGSRSEEVARGLQAAGVIVRPVANYGLPDYLRVSVGTEAQNRRFLGALESVLQPSRA